MEPKAPMKTLHVDAEDFAAWRELPITKLVFQAFERLAEKQKIAWDEKSWIAGTCDPLELSELRTRADAYRAIFESTADDVNKALEDQ